MRQYFILVVLLLTLLSGCSTGRTPEITTDSSLPKGTFQKDATTGQYYGIAYAEGYTMTVGEQVVFQVLGTNNQNFDEYLKKDDKHIVLGCLDEQGTIAYKTYSVSSQAWKEADWDKVETGRLMGSTKETPIRLKVKLNLVPKPLDVSQEICASRFATLEIFEG